MKKSESFYLNVIQSLILMCLMQVTVAQGLYSNTSQSAQYVRMLSRNASTAIDAVYYNPAGLIGLSEGWHFAVNDQAVFQTNTITNNYPLLNDGGYTGELTSPFIPSAFGAYKMGNVVFSVGAGISAGGGLITYGRGLPSFEIPLSRMIPELEALSSIRLSSFDYDISAYAGDIYYEERTKYPGVQAGITYVFNEVFSGYAGVRYGSGSGNYEGHVYDAQLIVDGDMVYASDWLSVTLLPAATSARNSYNGYAISVQQIITAGAGNLTIAQTQNMGYITSAQRAAFESALFVLGLTYSQIAALSMNQVKSYYSTEAANLASAITGITAALNDAVYKELKALQAGAGWTPVLGINLNVNDKVNVGMRYEFVTKLVVTNTTSKDDFNLYPDDESVEISIPSTLAIGIGYKPMDLLEAQLSFNMIFDRSVNWGLNIRDQVLQGVQDIRTREVTRNTWELALGLQYNIRNDLSLSAGVMTTQPGVADSYQSELGYVSPSVTVGTGIKWMITDMITLDAGIMNTFCKDVNLTYSDEKLQVWNNKYPTVYSGDSFESGEYSEKLAKRRLVISAGLTCSIFKPEN